MCRQVARDAAPAAMSTTLTHTAGHHVPHDAPSVQAVVAFVRAQLEGARATEEEEEPVHVQ